MDDRHMMFAVRYIENNPVAAGLVERAEDWPWSSAVAHIGQRDDGLTDWLFLGQHINDWRAMLADGLDASPIVETALRTGRVLGTVEAKVGVSL